MYRMFPRALAAVLWLTFGAGVTPASGEAAPQRSTGAPPVAPFVLGLPQGQGPLVVRVRFDLYEVNAIDDESETVDFTGVLTLKWRDHRQAFDPAIEGVAEKVFQGGFQFDEISPGWYPQVSLINDAGRFEMNSVMLRARPDGAMTLVQTVSALAETAIMLRRYPFDRHRLEAAFEILGFDASEVVFEVEAREGHTPLSLKPIPQWRVTDLQQIARERPAPYAGATGVSSSFVLSLSVAREPFFVIRLIVIPLVIIVLLSFSVFWMERSSLGDRISVSFIGILTGVAYQIVMSDTMPDIAYFTLIHGFLNLSFLAMCGTVVVNLVVGALDKHQRHEDGDRLDRRCRRLFPLAYFGLMLVMLTVALTAF